MQMTYQMERQQLRHDEIVAKRRIQQQADLLKVVHGDGVSSLNQEEMKTDGISRSVSSLAKSLGIEETPSTSSHG